MSTRKNQSENKAQKIIAKYIKYSGEDYTGNLRENMNWATGEEIDNLKRPTSKDFFDEVRNRRTESISDETIVIEENQKALNLVFRNGLNIRDIGNPMFGEENSTNKKNLSNNISLADAQNNKVCVIYGGDLLGEEWELKRLNNAKIIKTIDDSSYQEMKGILDDVQDDNAKPPKKNDVVYIKKALFFALGERVKVLKRDIVYTLRHPGVDIYLVNGAQEEKINKYFKIDVLKTIVEAINDPRVHYIKGVNTIVNVEKKNKDSASCFATIGLLTNNSLSKAQKGSAVVNAVKLNSGENLADVVFVTNTNVAGKKGPNDYYVSGESTFTETPAKKMPSDRPRGYNTFSLRVPSNGEITVIEGCDMPKENPLEMIVYREFVKNEVMRDTLKRRLASEINVYSLPIGKDPVRSIQQQFARQGSMPEFATEIQRPDDEFSKDMEG